MTRRLAIARTKAGKLGEGALLCLCAALIAFTAGSMSGFDTRPTRACVTQRTGTFDPQADNADIVITSRAFPPTTTCTWPDGEQVELVPVWINTVLIVSLAGAIVLAGCAVRASSPQPPRPSETQP